MDKPVSIAFTPQSRIDPAVTRSSDVESEEPVETTLLVTLGEYYAIRADFRDFEDGFCIVKALQAYTIKRVNRKVIPKWSFLRKLNIKISLM